MARSSEEMKGKTDFRKLVGRVSRLQVVEFSLLTVSDNASRVTWENSEKMVVLPPDGGSRSKREVVGGGILALMSSIFFLKKEANLLQALVERKCDGSWVGEMVNFSIVEKSTRLLLMLLLMRFEK